MFKDISAKAGVKVPQCAFAWVDLKRGKHFFWEHLSNCLRWFVHRIGHKKTHEYQILKETPRSSRKPAGKTGIQIFMTTTVFSRFCCCCWQVLKWKYSFGPAQVERSCRRKDIAGVSFSKRDKGEFDDGRGSSLEIAATHESSSPGAACYTIFQQSSATLSFTGHIQDVSATAAVTTDKCWPLNAPFSLSFQVDRTPSS